MSSKSTFSSTASATVATQHICLQQESPISWEGTAGSATYLHRCWSHQLLFVKCLQQLDIQLEILECLSS